MKDLHTGYWIVHIHKKESFSGGSNSGGKDEKGERQMRAVKNSGPIVPSGLLSLVRAQIW